MPILKSGNIPAPIVSVITSAISSLFGKLFPNEKWGIYEPGSEDAPVMFDSILELGINGSSDVSTYRIETGSFTSYNKVNNPTTIMIRGSKEGSAVVRSYINDWLELNSKSTTKFDIVTPEKRYNGYTLVEYKMLRGLETVGMILADLVFQEVIEVDATYLNSKISNPENIPPSPASRVQLGDPIEKVGDIKWQ